METLTPEEIELRRVLNEVLAEQAAATRVVTAAQLARMQAEKELAKANAILQQATNSATTGLTQVKNAFFGVEKGFGKFSAGMDNVGDAALTLSKNFGLAGVALGALVKGATMLASASFKQADAALKATDELSSVGAAGAFSATSVLKMGHAAGLTAANLDVFTKATKSIGSGLISLGGTVGDGVVAFSKMTEVSKEQREAFQRLGVSQEDLIQNQADFVSLQKASGTQITQQMKSGNGLRDASLVYTRNLLELSAITGESIEKTKKDVEIARSGYATLIQTNQMQQEMNRLLKEGGPENEKRVAQMQKEIEVRNNLLAVVQSIGDKDLMAGVEEFMASGALTQMSASLARAGVDLDKFRKRMMAGDEKVPADLAVALKEAIEQSVKAVGEPSKVDRSTGAAFLLNEQTLKWVASVRGRDEQAIREGVAKLIGEPEKGKTGAVVAEDPAQQARNALTTAEIRAKVKLDELVLAMNPLMTGWNALTVATTGLTVAAGAAAAALAAMAAKAGLATIGGGGPGGAGGRGGRGMGGKVGGVAGLAGGFLLNQAGTAATAAGNTKTGAGLDIAGSALMGASLGGMFGPMGAAVGGGLGAAYGAWQNRDTLFGSQGATAPGAEAVKEEKPSGSVGSLLDFIARYESRGDYNILVGGKRANLTEMTVGEVLRMQSTMNKSSGFESNAVGKYQIMMPTLLDMMKPAGVQLTDKFDESTQEKLGMALLKRRGLDNYLSKKITPDEFANNLAQEWAALPKENNVSAHEGKGSNKAGVSRAELMKMLPQARTGGFFSGPDSGYPVMLHNREAVIPLPNMDFSSTTEGAVSKTPLSALTSSSTATQASMDNSIDIMVSMLAEKLDNVINRLSTSNDIQDQLLMHSRV